MDLLDAIKIAHKGKTETLKVTRFSNCAFWDADNDTGWIKYQDARNTLYKHKRLEKLLVKLNWI